MIHLEMGLYEEKEFIIFVATYLNIPEVLNRYSARPTYLFKTNDNTVYDIVVSKSPLITNSTIFIPKVLNDDIFNIMVVKHDYEGDYKDNSTIKVFYKKIIDTIKKYNKQLSNYLIKDDYYFNISNKIINISAVEKYLIDNKFLTVFKLKNYTNYHLNIHDDSVT